ncbi:MAG: MoaD/ThiS family protein [Anaerolineales bacterium]|nr:MoaD/ThiS family protein [Anaerolineales bacterium]
MKIQVQLFSSLRACLPPEAERGKIDLDLPEGADLRAMCAALEVQRCLPAGSGLDELLKSWQVSVNHEFVLDLNHPLQDGDQVMIFPHMAGG